MGKGVARDIQGDAEGQDGRFQGGGVEPELRELREDMWEIGWPEISKETQEVKMGNSRVADDGKRCVQPLDVAGISFVME